MADYTIADLSEKTNITNCYVELDDNSPRENKNYGFKTIVGTGNGIATLQNGKLHPSQTPTTDYVAEGSDPLRKYYTKARFDFDFYDNIELIKNEENGILGLDNLKTAHAHDFKLIDPTQTLKAIYDNANQPDWFVKLNSSGKIDSQYLPPSPSGYTDNDARNALAAPDFDKILGIKNTAAASASMLSNTANLYVDSSGNEYLQHKIGSTVRNRRFAMHSTDVGFSTCAVASPDRAAKFQVNDFIKGSQVTFFNDSPALIATNLPNWDGTALRPMQDVLTFVCGGVTSQTYFNFVRHRVGGYAKNGTLVKTVYDICLTDDAVSELNNTQTTLRLLSDRSVIFAVKAEEPPDNMMFNRSMTLYTDSTQGYYIVKVKKNNGTVAPIGPANLITAGLPSSSNSLPKDALTFFYDELHNVICGARNASAGSMNEEAFAIRASALEPNFDNMLLGGQMQFYVVPNASKFDLYVKIKSMHSNISNTTFKLATSI